MQRVLGVQVLEGPRDWQIIQRNEYGAASITLRGTWNAMSDDDVNIQARIVDEQTNAPVSASLDWLSGTVDMEEKRFEIVLKGVPQGGLYRIETRIRRTGEDRRALRGDYIHHLGVGDIYVIAGQSNASGTGKGVVTDGPMLGVHLFANDEQWKLATHPLEDAQGTLHPITATGIFHGHSPWLAFAKHVFKKTGIPIGLIPTALGGSPISRWIHDVDCPGDLFENMKSMMTAAGGTIAGVLWYQGESDTDPQGVEMYPGRFRTFVDAARSYTSNATLPIYVGQLNRWTDANADDSSWSAIRDIQRRLALEMEHVHLVITIDSSLSDAIHNNAASNVVIGERFAAVALEKFYGLPKMTAFPAPARLYFTDNNRTRIRIEFVNVSGEWMASSPVITDFYVEDGGRAVQMEAVTIHPDNSVEIELDHSCTGEVVVHCMFGGNPSISLRDDLGRCAVPFSMTVERVLGA
ncbi:sialate O-acetylesterase [Alicyclobacillus sp. SO9]|uniref:sialate O-acetylesterase n=1 Tax=Alicyclobacillus sp. SO9 TaxID=2665646 RepID=UPI0018E8258D|nr:sialate O-acetylesterase [Alicyclobacillus sp. SO9]QQE77953.1 hypothetical protein GI364_18865 [Alicyclobacillus sp. SO9]